MFPEKWKIAQVTPLHKEGVRNDINNYRPISILPTLSKIFEKHVANSLLKFLRENNPIYCGVDKGGSAPPMNWRTTPVKRWNPRRNWGGGRWLCVILKSKIFFCKISPAKCRKSYLRYSRFQNFPGSMPPDPLGWLAPSSLALCPPPQNYDPGYATAYI